MILSNKELTMSSLEIAKLCEKNHADVLRDIRKIFEEAEIGESKFAGTYIDVQNKERPCYNLPRRECDLIITGYSVKYRLAIIDRWMELEKSQPRVPQTFAEALMLAAKSEFEKEEALKQLSIDHPKAEVYDQFCEKKGKRSVMKWIKAIREQHNFVATRKQVFSWLRAEGYIYRSGKDNMPYAAYEAGGLNWFSNNINFRDSGTHHGLLITNEGMLALTPKIIEAFGHQVASFD